VQPNKNKAILLQGGTHLCIFSFSIICKHFYACLERFVSHHLHFLVENIVKSVRHAGFSFFYNKSAEASFEFIKDWPKSCFIHSEYIVLHFLHRETLREVFSDNKISLILHVGLKHVQMTKPC